jgi:Zn-finger nucleic acid-binding protein
MKCPNCNETLVMADRNGVEIDYCPNCRGVWLDKGELDKIIDRSIDTQPGRPAQPQQPRYDEREYRSKEDYYKSEQYKKKKRDSFLGDLFDF